MARFCGWVRGGCAGCVGLGKIRVGHPPHTLRPPHNIMIVQGSRVGPPVPEQIHGSLMESRWNSQTLRRSLPIMESEKSPRKGLSPLWIIASFLSFTETVLGVAVVRTTGGVQIALTVFVVLFPVLVSSFFFAVLWKRPFYFYTPGDFRDIDVHSYVEAMRSGVLPVQGASVSNLAIRNLELRVASLAQSLETTHSPRDQAALLVRGAIEAVKESVVSIDSRPLYGPKGRVWELPFDKTSRVDHFLNMLFFEMQPQGLRPFTYGSFWLLQVEKTGEILTDIGTKWAESHGMSSDSRNLGEIGLKGGMTLNVLPSKARGRFIQS